MNNKKNIYNNILLLNFLCMNKCEMILFELGGGEVFKNETTRLTLVFVFIAIGNYKLLKINFVNILSTLLNTNFCIKK